MTLTLLSVECWDCWNIWFNSSLFFNWSMIFFFPPGHACKVWLLLLLRIVEVHMCVLLTEHLLFLQFKQSHHASLPCRLVSDTWSVLIIVAAKPPIVIFQPTSHNDIVQGKAVGFSVQAAGAKPLSYQWQWKQFGKKGENDEWQNLTSESVTFLVVKVQACNAGYYRCVVSNSAGSETSQCASLTVGKCMYQYLFWLK